MKSEDFKEGKRWFKPLGRGISWGIEGKNDPACLFTLPGQWSSLGNDPADRSGEGFDCASRASTSPDKSG